MPGSPPVTPNMGLPRFSQADDADYSDQTNAVADAVDVKAALATDPRLTNQRTPSDGSVTAAKIAAGAVLAAALGPGAVTSAALAAGAVVTAALADQGITDAKIANQGIQTDSYALQSVTTAVLADGAVTPSKLQVAIQPAINVPGDLIISCAAARAGCLLCDGSAISRSQYAALFAAIGTTYGSGAGDGVTFSLPDFRQRVIIGAGAVGGDTNRPTVRQLGQVGGTETYRLTPTDLPGHTHNFSGTTGADSPDHAHSGTTAGDYPDHVHQQTVVNNPGNSIARFSEVASGGYPWNVGSTGGASARHQHDFGTSGATARHAHAFSGTTDGGAVGSGAHPNVPPFGVANVFIKT